MSKAFTLPIEDGAAGRGAGGPPIEGYDEGYAGGGFGDEPRAAATPARSRTLVKDLDDDIPF